MIIVYRFEDNEGNGPFIKRDGNPSYFGNPNIYINVNIDKLLSACMGVNELIEYFKTKVNLLQLLENFHIVAYLVPQVQYTQTHVLFDPNIANRLGDI